MDDATPSSSESPSPSHEAHQVKAKHAVDAASIRCAVLTVSDTRTLENDQSGDLIERLLLAAGHLAIHRAIVRDEPGEIEHQLRHWMADPAVNVILTTGGTGIARRDTTIEVVRRLLTAELDGFGELFRMLSWQEVKAAAMLSRAVGGLVVRDRETTKRQDGERSEQVDAERIQSDGVHDLDREMSDVFIFAMPGSQNAVRTAMKQLIIPQLPHLVWERTR
jgi:molybdopterin adenylyltransferase